MTCAPLGKGARIRSFQALLLDVLGAHETAAAYLETLLRLQGSKSFPGLHRAMEEAIFHGARVNEEYDYTASERSARRGCRRQGSSGRQVRGCMLFL